MKNLFNGLLMSSLLVCSTAAFAQQGACNNTRVVINQMGDNSARFANATKYLLKDAGGTIEVKNVEKCIELEFQKGFETTFLIAELNCTEHQISFESEFQIDSGPGTSLECRKAIAKSIVKLGAKKDNIRVSNYSDEANTVYISIPKNSFTQLQIQELIRSEKENSIDELLK